jgi:hypothetical protein
VDKLVLNCHVSDSLSDHYVVHWLANADRFVPRKLSLSETSKLLTWSSLPLISSASLFSLKLLMSDDIVRLLEWYNTGLTEVLDKQASLQIRVFTIRPDNLWNNQTIASTRKKVKRLERRWKATGLAIDREVLHHALGELRGLISAVIFLTLRLLSQLERSHYLRLLTSFLKKPALRLPSHGNLPALLEDFDNFFLKKIQDIRLCLVSAGPALDLELPMTSRIFAEFTPDVLSLIAHSPTKSPPLDPDQQFS